MKFKVGDVLTCVEAYGVHSNKLGTEAVVWGIVDGSVYPIQIKVIKSKSDYFEVGDKDPLTKDGWFYAHETKHNFRFDIVEEFEGNV